MDKHTKQIKAFKDTSRFKFYLAGRRGGKTFAIIEDILLNIFKAPNNAELCYIGPTLQQSYELIWDALEIRLRELGWAYYPLVSKRRFEFSRGRKFYILGAEKISRVRGHKFFRVWLDEIAYFETNLQYIWDAVRPTLSDYRGGAIVSTTPDGKGSEAYNFYLSTIEKADWKYFHWKTIDNPFIAKEEIASAKKELDEKSFKQEYEAEWESYEGLVYYNFKENDHIVSDLKIDYRYPLHLCFDFNVNPTTLLLSQYIDGVLYYVKEYSYKHSSTEETIKAFCEDFSNVKNQVSLKVRGDASGKGRSSTTGKSDYFYVEQMLDFYGYKFVREVPSRNPLVIDRLKHVNSWLTPLEGNAKIKIDSKCKNLIIDLSSQQLNGRMPDDKGNLGHKADALGYDVWQQVIRTSPISQSTIQL